MNPTTISLSLPPEQLQLLEAVKILNEQVLASKNENQWLTETEAAQRLKVSKSTIEKWRHEGKLRYKRDGVIIRYRANQLDEDFENFAGVVAFAAQLGKRKNR
jgi:excisionase family DNA binding protein